MLTGIKNILFDLGGVLFHIDYQITINNFLKIGVNDIKQNFSQFKQNSIFDNLETGVITPEHFINSIKKKYPKLSSEKIIHAWNSMLIGLPKENLELLKKLSKKYRLFLLSNANYIHIEEVNKKIKSKYNLNSIDIYFEKAYYSHIIGKRKPDEKTFKWVINDANILAEETLFIEDTIQHIEGAKKANLKTHHIESNSSLASIFPDIAQ